MASSVGVIGLGSIGKNLALNIQEKQKLHVYNKTQSKVVTLEEQSENVFGHESIGEMVDAMKWPRVVFTALPHGQATDDTVRILLEHMRPNDTIVDCSNEYYRVSRTRGARCKSRKVNYLGTGLSGGAEGARTGPALMIGGTKSAYEMHKPLLSKFAKRHTYMGEDFGVGHFTKMVHNGVEYGMLQAVADLYAYRDHDDDRMQKSLEHAIGTDMDGYIVRSALKVLENYDMSKISDVAEMNNTGLWCSQVGLEYEIPTPVINSAVNTRITSKYIKSVRTKQKITASFKPIVGMNTLRFTFAASLLEGFDLMRTRNASKQDVINAWSRGTIIECPLIASELHGIMDKHILDARIFALHCMTAGVPCPAVHAAINQYDFIHQQKTSMSFLMAQRNYFGQHTLIEV